MLVVFILAFVANNFAQNDAIAAPLTTVKTDKKGGKKMQKAAKELDLTPEQKTKMKEIGQSFKGKMMAIKSDASLSKEQKRTQILEVMKSHEADLKALLSPEQFAKWQEMKAARRDKMKEYRGKKGAAQSDEDGQ